jgi:hypothetical protein
MIAGSKGKTQAEITTQENVNALTTYKRWLKSLRWQAALAISGDSDCSELISKANDYAAAKVAYYKATRQAMPALLEIAKRQATDSRYGNELIEIFRGFGEDRDEEATGALEAKLNRCPPSDQRDQARLAVEEAKQTAEQFVKDFGGLEGAWWCNRNFNQRTLSSTEGTNPRRRGWDFDCRLSRADSRWGNQCMVWSLRKSGCWMSLDIFDRFEPLLGTGYLVSPRQSLWQESESFLVNQLVGSPSFSFPKLRPWQPQRHEI